MTDSQWKWAVIENICWIVLIGFLCWVLSSGWPCLLAICLNSPVCRIAGKKKQPSQEDKANAG